MRSSLDPAIFAILELQQSPFLFCNFLQKGIAKNIRANYTNLQKGVHETTEYLEVFLRNLLLGENTPLHNRDMHISGILHSDKASADLINGPINDPINDPIKLTEREKQLLRLLRESPELTRKVLAEKLGCSDSTVKRELQLLSEKGVLRRIGSKKTGAWVINRQV